MNKSMECTNCGKKECYRSKCDMCDNAGIRYVSDGPDDFRLEYCVCPEGQRAEGVDITRKLPILFLESNGAPVITRL